MMARRCQKFIFLILMHGWITVCSTFYDILKPKVGVYTDESGIASRFSEKVKLTVSQTIFLTVVNNNDDRQLLLNFECFTKRLGLKLMIIGSNASGFNSALASTPNFHYYSFNLSHFSRNKFQIIDSSPEIAKSVVIFEILQLGYNVLFAEPDVIMLRDPFPYLLHHNMDAVYAPNSKYTREGLRELQDEPVLVDDIDESFFFVRSNNRTIKLWNDTVQTYASSNDSHQLVVQKELAINTTLYTGGCRDVTDEEQTLQHEESVTGSETFDIDFTLKDHQAVHIPEIFKEKRLTICSLNSCMFSSCMLPQYKKLILQLHAMHLPSITIHANCINSTDDKKNLLQAAGLWMLRSNEGECEVNWLPQQHSHLSRNKRTNKRPAKRQQASGDNNNVVKPVIDSNSALPAESIIKPVLEKSIQEVQSIQQSLLLYHKRTKSTNKMLRDRSHHKQPRREVKDTTVLTKSKKYYHPDSKEKKSKPF